MRTLLLWSLVFALVALGVAAYRTSADELEWSGFFYTERWR